jgi:hypothetical protein
MKTFSFIAVTAAALLAAAGPSYANSTTVISGRIASIDAKNRLTIQTGDGTIIHVALHRGTVILPTGLPLKRGMLASVSGTSVAGELDANEISTPYAYAGVGGFFKDGAIAGPNTYVPTESACSVGYPPPACTGAFPAPSSSAVSSNRQKSPSN